MAWQKGGDLPGPCGGLRVSAGFEEFVCQRIPF